MASERLTAAQVRLSAARARQRRRALGPALSVDDAALDALARVSEADLPEVEAFVRDAAGRAGVDLLNAEREG